MKGSFVKYIEGTLALEILYLQYVVTHTHTLSHKLHRPQHGRYAYTAISQTEGHTLLVNSEIDTLLCEGV